MGIVTSTARGDAKNPAGGHAHAVFTLLRLCVSTVEDRGDATAWRETLRPHDTPVTPESNGGIYYEVIRSKGMYLLRRSPESARHENVGICYQNAKRSRRYRGGREGGVGTAPPSLGERSRARRFCRPSVAKVLVAPVVLEWRGWRGVGVGER